MQWLDIKEFKHKRAKLLCWYGKGQWDTFHVPDEKEHWEKMVAVYGITHYLQVEGPQT